MGLMLIAECSPSLRGSSECLGEGVFVLSTYYL